MSTTYLFEVKFINGTETTSNVDTILENPTEEELFSTTKSIFNSLRQDTDTLMTPRVSNGVVFCFESEDGSITTLILYITDPTDGTLKTANQVNPNILSELVLATREYESEAIGHLMDEEDKELQFFKSRPTIDEYIKEHGNNISSNGGYVLPGK